MRPGDVRCAAFFLWRVRVFAHVRAAVREQVAVDSPAELEDTP
jgi:hypothetical protein